MRRIALIVLVGAAGCGSEPQRENVDRPAPLVVMTAAVQDDVVRVSPRTVGAGQIEVVVSNQSDSPQTVTFETDELGGSQGGNRASSSEIAVGGTGRLKIDAREGTVLDQRQGRRDPCCAGRDRASARVGAEPVALALIAAV